MGSSISMIHEDYEAYLLLCKNTNETPKGIREEFYTHSEELCLKHGYIESSSGFYKKGHG